MKGKDPDWMDKFLGSMGIKKIKGPKRTKDPAYRYNEPQRGARNPDGTRR